jgi:hypothetical protein
MAKVQDSKKRQEIRGDFFEEIVPRLLTSLTENRNLNEKSRALERALGDSKYGSRIDWEFKFTVNYFLREDEYNDEPYTELRQTIRDFFTAKQGES